MRPMSGCALFGASKALAGIKDAVILQHSVIGCNWGSLNLHYANKPYDVRQASTVIYDDNVIYGGDGLLGKAVQEIDELYPECGAVFVISGCVPNLIGDDAESVLRQAVSGKKLLHVSAPGYGKSFDDGVEAALYCLQELAAPAAKSAVPSVNIIGITADDPYAAGDIRALKKLLNGKVKINCSLHECSLAEISSLPAAWLNIVFGCGEKLARHLQERFAVPYVQWDYPYGIQGGVDFLRGLEQLLGVDFTEEIARLESDAQALVRRTADYLTNLYQLPAAVTGDKAHLSGMKKFLERELGMEVVISMDCNNGDFNALEEEIRRKSPVLLLGSSFAKYLADAYHLPLVRYIYPIIDELDFTGGSLLGAAGTGHLLEKIVNASLQTQYKADGVYCRLQTRGKAT